MALSLEESPPSGRGRMSTLQQEGLGQTTISGRGRQLFDWRSRGQTRCERNDRFCGTCQWSLPRAKVPRVLSVPLAGRLSKSWTKAPRQVSGTPDLNSANEPGIDRNQTAVEGRSGDEHSLVATSFHEERNVPILAFNSAISKTQVDITANPRNDPLASYFFIINC